MLVVSLPKGELSGTCRINGETSEFRVEADRFKYRSESSSEWKHQYIKSIANGEKLDTYICTAAPEEAPAVFTLDSLPAPESAGDADLFQILIQQCLPTMKSNFEQAFARQPELRGLALPGFLLLDQSDTEGCRIAKRLQTSASRDTPPAGSTNISVMLGDRISIANELEVLSSQVAITLAYQEPAPGFVWCAGVFRDRVWLAELGVSLLEEAPAAR